MTGRAEDVVFVINPSLWHKPMYPTGILCLSNYLEARGVSNRILDSRLSPRKERIPARIEKILKAIQRMKPKVVCFSSTHREFDEVVRMNEGIRNLTFGVRTIVGGAQPTYRSSDFLDNGFDFVCLGEGEKTLVEFVAEAGKKNPAWETIDGLIFKDGPRTVANKDRTLLAEAELPGESHRGAALAYPCAIEHDGKLYVGYSNSGGGVGRVGKGRELWNNNSAEMAVVPIEKLRVCP